MFLPRNATLSLSLSLTRVAIRLVRPVRAVEDAVADHISDGGGGGGGHGRGRRRGPGKKYLTDSRGNGIAMLTEKKTALLFLTTFLSFPPKLPGK